MKRGLYRLGRRQTLLFENATINYKTEREPVLAVALGPLACPSRGDQPP